MPKEFRVARPKTSLDDAVTKPFILKPVLAPHRSDVASTRRASSAQPFADKSDGLASKGSQILVLDHNDDTHPSIPSIDILSHRSSRRRSTSKAATPEILPGPKSASSWRAPRTHSPPVPTHRIKNLQTKIGGKHHGNFFVAEGGVEATFTPQQLAKITNKPMKSSRSLGKAHG